VSAADDVRESRLRADNGFALLRLGNAKGRVIDHEAMVELLRFHRILEPTVEDDDYPKVLEGLGNFIRTLVLTSGIEWRCYEEFIEQLRAEKCESETSETLRRAMR
jgi:hypothetical protein